MTINWYTLLYNFYPFFLLIWKAQNDLKDGGGCDGGGERGGNRRSGGERNRKEKDIYEVRKKVIINNMMK